MSTDASIKDPRARIRQHLADVDQELTRVGVPDTQRRGIVDDLSAQIADMLAERGAEPTAADVEGLLARLDAPAAFALACASAARDGGSAATPTGLEMAARVAFWCAIVGVPAGVAVGMIASSAGHDGSGAGFLMFLGCEFTAVGAGIAARRHLIARAGAWIGAALIVTALVCATVFPPPASRAAPPEQARPPTAP